MANSHNTNTSKDDNVRSEQWDCTHLLEEKLSYKWTISNVHYCLGQLTSPPFSLKTTDELQWQLLLWYCPCDPKSRPGINDRLLVSLRLFKALQFHVCVSWKVSIITSELQEVNGRASTGSAICKKGTCENTHIMDFETRHLCISKNGAFSGTFTICCDLRYNTEVSTLPGPTTSIKSESRLSHDLETLLETETLSDVALFVGDKVLRAHKAILAARSPVFSAMFRNDMEERNQDRINITDIDEKVLREMLRFIYTGKVKDLENMAGELLIVADKYDIKELKVTCEGALCLNLGVENAADLMILADKHGAEQLMAGIVKFVKAHQPEMKNNIRFKEMLTARHRIAVDIVVELFSAL